MFRKQGTASTEKKKSGKEEKRTDVQKADEE
jgi:hypothetical protein